MAPPTTALECVPAPPDERAHAHDGAADLAAAIVLVNNEHADEVAVLAARRGAVSPADARGALLIAADGTSGELSIQLWEGRIVCVSTNGSALKHNVVPERMERDVMAGSRRQRYTSEELLERIQRAARE